EPGHLKKAYEHIRELVKIYPRAPKIKVLLAFLYFQDGKAGPAVRILNEVVALYPEEIEARKLLASIYADQGQYGEAREQYVDILSYQPADIDAISGLGNVYLAAGDWPSAINCYERLLPNCDTYAQRAKLAAAYMTLGDLYAASGEGAKAVRYWSKVSQDFKEQPYLGEICAYMSGSLEKSHFLSKIKQWQPEFRAMARTHITIKMKMERDKEGHYE
ncbi:MAG: tetratricopeptide repeat protein, partial [Candidatus Omnitrophota bacterium]